ncbi:unnamed protein product [Eruca vesicaria subsp. sativa]|uniref:Hydroxyproline-rich glycoprotein family protein n=1 Tax=Eruca vesicaria subsp. sativa TaxID=29727 RepID=A0ABC8IRC3_ERUVS|nr:unnamed protein product [Eruca vesicaria subsp. sativa]
MGSEQHRFPQHEQQQQRKRWGGCLGVFSCFKSQKAQKRIVPASRIQEVPTNNLSPSQPNGSVLTNQATRAMNLAFMAPPSSPASFTNSPLPSTTNSPNNYLSLSANSPGDPSSSIYATGPYANEPQLVSPPPVFSTFTTEPSTAPFTPPQELAHLTTPSSPDVPYARFLASTYAIYPVSPASSLRSPISRASGVSTPLQESNFFCPETFAKFYLDHDPSVPLNGGRLSVSKDSDVYPTSQNRQTRSPKRDMEELEEAYRASFGFSADDVITTSQYVEFNDVMDDSLLLRREADLDSPKGHKPRKGIHADEEVLLSRVGSVKKGNRSYLSGVSSSDAEIEYIRGRSLRESRENRHRR